MPRGAKITTKPVQMPREESMMNKNSDKDNTGMKVMR